MTRLMTRQNWSALRLGFAALLVAAMSVFAFAPAASAHDQLVSSNPEDGAELDQQPKWLEMTFSGDIQEVGSEVKVVVDGKDLIVGGTSASSPAWLGIWARAQQAHGGRLGFANPALYRVPPSAFHDVVAGSQVLHAATPGWDYCTGRGTPDIAALVRAL